jgi:hypothetical protein
MTKGNRYLLYRLFLHICPICSSAVATLFIPLQSIVRQIFVGLNLIVREIYVLSFEIVVLCLLLFTSSSLLFALPSIDFAFDTIFPL